MKKYYKVLVNETSRAINNKQEQYQIFNEFSETFKTVKEAKEYIVERYEGNKKSKMYIDDKKGNSQHIGYIYSFKNKDYSHDSESWYQQDWVSITEVKEKSVI